MSTFSAWTSFPQKLLPQASDGVTITPDATAFTNSAYAEITSGLSTPIIIVGLLVNNQTIVADYRIDVATGASLSEVVRGTLTNRIETDAGGGFLEFKTPLQIPASTRIAVRLRKSGTSVATWNVKIVYYEIEGTIFDRSVDMVVTADFNVVPNLVHNRTVDMVVLAEFAVAYVIINPPGVAGTPTSFSLPVRNTLYLKLRRRL